jgi:hypothetical protein
MSKGLGVNKRMNGGSFGDRFTLGFNRSQFARPYSGSALLAGPRTQSCPTCGCENRLSERDILRGYQCDQCARRDEGVGF